MNWAPPTRRFIIGILHQVQVRSGMSAKDGGAWSGWLLGACDMLVILSEGF